MFYKDGKTEPKKGDTVLGEKIKGTVDAVLKDKVAVSFLGPFDQRRGKAKRLLAEKDPQELELVYRP